MYQPFPSFAPLGFGFVKLSYVYCCTSPPVSLSESVRRTEVGFALMLFERPLVSPHAVMAWPPDPIVEPATGQLMLRPTKSVPRSSLPMNCAPFASDHGSFGDLFP